MQKRKLNIAFMGTPDFAVPSLSILVDNGYNVAAVVTAVDKAAGRGLKTKESAVKTYAISKNLQVLQPESLSNEDFLEQLKELEINLIVVVAFKKLPTSVFTLPEYGTFNLHASLLPQYRGAAPIQRAIMNGDSESGVTTFFIEEKIDTGKIILQKAVVIEKDHNAGDLHDNLMNAGAEAVLETVSKIESANVKEVDQEELMVSGQELRRAPKIFREDCKINWKLAADEIHNQIRALSPYPGAYSAILGPDGKSIDIKILKSELIAMANNPSKAVLKTDGKTYLKIDCIGGELLILRIQAAGKKAMDIEDWLRGANINNNWYVD